ncbi:Annexin A7 [Trichoplax sp. H2]|nr:Annexin A7 [Trichoplax sp. H2]|eukprot:RDD36416.1 Annexin A7 [Trichoplax sp. H2]
MNNQSPYGFNPGVGSNYSPYPPSHPPAGYPPQTSMPSASPYPPQPGYPPAAPAPAQSHNAPGWFGNTAAAVMAANAFQRPTHQVGFNTMPSQSTPYPSAMPTPGPGPASGMPPAPMPAVPPTAGYLPQPGMPVPTPTPSVAMPAAPQGAMPAAPTAMHAPPSHTSTPHAYPANPMPTAAAPPVSMPAAPAPASAAYTSTSAPPMASQPPLPQSTNMPSHPSAPTVVPAPSPSVPPPAKDYQSKTSTSSQVTSVTASMAATKISKVNRGTVKDYSPFSSETDAEILKKAMKGFGCDEKAIIFIMYSRSHQQRQQIVRDFKTLFGKDLIKCLKNELSGKVQDTVLALLKEPAEVDAHELRKAMKGLGTTESTLVEIICSRNNQELSDIKAAFKNEYDRDLEKDVYSETSGHFRNFLASLLHGNRSDDQTVDVQQSAKEAKALYKAGEARWGTDESKFKTLLAARSYPQLRSIFQEYSKICKYTIEESIKREMSGDLMKFSCAQSTPMYLAQRLHKALTGSLDSSAVIRIVVTRSEVDMEDIKAEFLKLYGKRVEDVVEDKLSGSFKRIILGLLGARE